MYSLYVFRFVLIKDKFTHRFEFSSTQSTCRMPA